MKKEYVVLVVSFVFLLASGFGCGKSGPKEFVILSGSENESLEPILYAFGKQKKTNIIMQYQGSVDIKQALGLAEIPYDAVWPANSLWIALGDTKRRVKSARSIMTSPVAFGIRQSLAEKFGFVGKDVYVRDILNAIRNKQLRFMMTSATQSNSGASAYMGFLYALLGNPDVITLADLQKPELRQDIRELLAGVNRSSGSSGWLKELFLNGNYDAMVNYESILIEANQELIRQGREPLYIVYPVDGIVLSDSPLGYIDHGDQKKAGFFQALQEHLLSDEIQQQISKMGRRTGVGGVMADVDPNVFNPQWGIDVNKVLSPITIPSAEVIQEALSMYQTEFRKPSLTVFCLDFSGSMEGEGVMQLKQAMALLLDQQRAREYMLNASSQDYTIVIPFDGAPRDVWGTEGNDPNELAALLTKIQALAPNDGTNIYQAAQRGLDVMSRINLDKYAPAIILMTDGQSEGSFASFENAWRNFGRDIPVFSIMFGEAEETQLKALADLTRSRVFDGRHDLVKAFRTAKGYN